MRPERHLRVWVITPSLDRAGATERAVAESLLRWRDRFDLSLYTMDVRDVDTTGIRVRRLWRPPGPHLVRWSWWLVANTVVRWWDERRLGAPDVVHSPGVNALDADAIGVHMLFAKHWAQIRASFTAQLRRRPFDVRAWHRALYWLLVRTVERRAYSGAAALWALSPADAAALEVAFNRPAGSVPVVPYGVDTGSFNASVRIATRPAARAELSVSDQQVLLLVGNDWHKKGLDRALAALGQLPDSCVLCVAGRDRPAPFLETARRLGVAGRVRFWPWRPDVVEYYAAADCLLAPSREDAFHLPALEAVACGLPVVLSPEAGAAAGLNGAAVVAHDADQPQVLAAAVRQALAAPQPERERRGRDVVRRLTWDHYADSTAALIEEEAAALRVLVLAPDPWGGGGIERATRAAVDALVRTWGASRVGIVPVWGPADGGPFVEGRVLGALAGRPQPGFPRVSLWRRVHHVVTALRAARRWRGRRLVVLAMHAHLAPVARLCRLLSGARYAVWGHGIEVWGRPRASVLRALRAADALWAGSRFTGNAMDLLTGRRSSTQRYPLTAELPAVRRPAAASERPTVLTVARLDRANDYKGVDTLILAWPRVLSRVPDAVLRVVGEGRDRERLQRLARYVGAGDRVRFEGRLSDAALADAYAAAAVFALPGRATLGNRPSGEGFGLVFLEAAAAGLPCVAGRAGGAPEAVVDGETGIVVDPWSPLSVADALATLLRDPSLARRMGAAGRARVAADFGFERFADDIAGRCRDLCAAGSA